MIPKIIHYIWFGDSEKPISVRQNIKNWEEKAPNFKIIEWNENNFPVSDYPFVKEAISEKKYAFASDFARLWVVYNYGGIYLDTDVEILKSFEELLSEKCFFSCEEVDSIASGLGFGSEKENKILKELMGLYNENFVQNGEPDLTTTNTKITTYFVDKGYKIKNRIQVINGVKIYPKEYFAPMNWWNQKINITEKTYAIHKYDGTWVEKNKINAVTPIKHYMGVSTCYVLGYKTTFKLKQLAKKFIS